MGSKKVDDHHWAVAVPTNRPSSKVPDTVNDKDPFVEAVVVEQVGNHCCCSVGPQIKGLVRTEAVAVVEVAVVVVVDDE